MAKFPTRSLRHHPGRPSPRGRPPRSAPQGPRLDRVRLGRPRDGSHRRRWCRGLSRSSTTTSSSRAFSVERRPPRPTPTPTPTPTSLRSSIRRSSVTILNGTETAGLAAGVGDAMRDGRMGGRRLHRQRECHRLQDDHRLLRRSCERGSRPRAWPMPCSPRRPPMRRRTVSPCRSPPCGSSSPTSSRGRSYRRARRRLRRTVRRRLDRRTCSVGLVEVASRPRISVMFPSC